MFEESKKDLKSKSLYVALFAEMLGTMFLVLVACGSCVAGNVVQISLCFALSIATIVWNIARVSGGHINPAVTLGFLVARRISLVRALLYVPCQMLGAAIGAGVLKAVSKGTVQNAFPALGTSAPGPGSKITTGEVFGIELLITFVLVWTVFSTVDGRRRDLAGSGPLAIGLSIGMCHLFAVPFTGAGMNPARVFGPAVVSGNWDFHWAYWVGPILGGIAAALLYDFLFAVNATPAKLRGCFTASYDDNNYDQTGPVGRSGDDPQNTSTLPLKEAV